MLYKKLFSIALFILLLFSFINLPVYKNSVAETIIIKKSDCDTTYQRVFSEGIWWIYVYSCDGSLIDLYPED